VAQEAITTNLQPASSKFAPGGFQLCYCSLNLSLSLLMRNSLIEPCCRTSLTTVYNVLSKRLRLESTALIALIYWLDSSADSSNLSNTAGQAG